MLSLASIDSDNANSDSSSDDMETDSVIHDADGVAIGETRRQRPPLPNADYSTTNSNIRLIKTIGYDPHTTKPQKEAEAPLPVSDLYDTANESNRVASRITSTITERVQQNRTGDVPTPIAQDTARPAYMMGMHDARPVSERATRHVPTRRALTETRVNETAGWGASPVSVAINAISGVYDKLTKGLRVDKTDTSLKIPNSHEQDTIKTASSLREFDPNRGRSTAFLPPPPPDATATDHAKIATRTDNVAFERTSLVLPMAGYGQITIDGEWNNFTSKHDKLEHQLVEVEKAEMQLHRGQLIPCTAHPAHPTGFDTIVRKGLNITHHHQRFGREQQTAVGPLQQTGMDALVRQEPDIQPHMRRFGHEQPTAVGPLQQTGLDARTRQHINIDPHMQRFGHEQLTAVGPLQQTGLDARTRQHINIDPHMQRFGHEQLTAVGPLQQTGLDARTRPELDIDPHMRRFGHDQHTAVGPLQQTGLDGIQHTQLDLNPHLRTFGHEQHTAVGTLQQSSTDRRVHTHINLEPHMQRFGQHQPTALGPLQPTGFDATIRTQPDLDLHRRRFGHEQHTAVGPLHPTGLDGKVRTQIDLDTHHRRFGYEHQTAGGPLLPTGLDGNVRTELDINQHHRRFGHQQQTSMGPLQPTGFDAIPRTEIDIDQYQRQIGHTQTAIGHTTTSTFDHNHKTEEDISIHSRDLGKVHGTAIRSQPTHTAPEGRAARVSPLNTSEMSRSMDLAFAYTGAPNSNVDTDRNAMHRTELSASAPSCGTRSMTTAAVAHSSSDPAGIFTQRASYEQNVTDNLTTDNFATDLSWISTPNHTGVSVSASEPSRMRVPDSMPLRLQPGEPGNSASHSTTVAARDITKKRKLPTFNRQQSTSDQTVFHKLPVIYESRRKGAMSAEVEPPPPASEYQQTPQNTDLPDDEASE